MKSNSTTMVFRRFVASQFGGAEEARIFKTGGSAPETDIIQDTCPQLSLFCIGLIV